MGAPDPRTERTVENGGAAKTIDLKAGRNWWAFLPVVEGAAPVVKERAWARKKIDFFVLQELEAKQLSPSPQADPRTLIQRAYLDLTGLRPTYEQSEAFAKDPSDKAYEQLIEQLLASPQYGERWGRYWLDVARYGEDNPTTEATNPPYPFAWRYRDWVIDAVNHDVPYDRFVTLQLAADLMPGTPRGDLAATGFLGAGPVYHKDGRLSKDVIENLYMDDWDERVDVVSRGVLGLTVACARCHDHKFDPIPTRDYYALAGVFASTVAAPRPLADVDPEVETRFMVAAQRLFYLSYAANLLRGEPGSKPKEARQKVEQLVAETGQDRRRDRSPPREVSGSVRLPRQARQAPRPIPAMALAMPPAPAAKPPFRRRPGQRGVGGGGGSSRAVLSIGVFDAGLWVDGSDPDLTHARHQARRSRTTCTCCPAATSPSPANSRRVVSLGAVQGRSSVSQGSGRLELAEKIFTDAAPLAARVIVNRVWGWHFGKPLVDTPERLRRPGRKADAPAAARRSGRRFIANGWSLKWLHREIMLSAAYRQASHPRAEAIKIDPANRLLWRMNPRRLDVEAYRDCILQATGSLDTSWADLRPTWTKPATTAARSTPASAAAG